MAEEEEEFAGLPGIDKYFEARSFGVPILSSDVKHFSDLIEAKTILNADQSKQIAILFFEVLRAAILNGEVVFLKGFGKFYVSSPVISETKERVFVKFEPSKSLIEKLNLET